MRKTRFFQQDAYITVDFLEKKASVFKMKNADEDTSPFSVTFDPGNGKPVKEVFFDEPDIDEVNAIREELASFYNAIKNNVTPEVSIEDGAKALEVAHDVLDKLKMSAAIV
jgi:flagellar basal body rod protein FlgC